LPRVELPPIGVRRRDPGGLDDGAHQRPSDVAPHWRRAVGGCFPSPGWGRRRAERSKGPIPGAGVPGGDDDDSARDWSQP
ncbi:unnamed protein product, partial [Urochloa humidicola]